MSQDPSSLWFISELSSSQLPLQALAEEVVQHVAMDCLIRWLTQEEQCMVGLAGLNSLQKLMDA